MAPPPKSRNNRRSSSSSSYTSTLTTLLFVSICVLAIWMLSSNSAVSPNIHNNDSITDELPQTTTTTTTSAATARSRDQKDPDDPIKSADRNKHHEVDNDHQTTIQDNSIQHIQSHQNPEQSIGGEQDVPSEVKQNEQKQNLVDDSVEIEKPKEEKKRRKPKKESKKPEGDESEGEKERQREESDGNEEMQHLEWHLCNVTAGADFIPCLDNEKYLKTSHRRHYEHRERHCPEDAPTCLVPLPQGYKTPVQWPNSRDKIWYHNVPHTKLAEVKGHQNWVKLTGEFLTFPGGGTQFIHGALHYIDFLQQVVFIIIMENCGKIRPTQPQLQL